MLKLAFGYPIVAMGDQVSVGGGRFDGRGEKIADFTAVAALSGNLALVEIKKPGSRLLTKTPYREGVYAPSHELSGSIAQVLDQKYQLQTDFAIKKVKSRAWDVEAYAIQCLVVIGSNPTTENERKCFELFHRDLKQVLIITFDELLAKLKIILDFLKASLPSLSEPESETPLRNTTNDVKIAPVANDVLVDEEDEGNRTATVGGL